MKHKLLALLLLTLSASAFADFQSDLKVKFPQLKDAKVEKSFGDFYSVVTGQEVIFISSDMNFIVNGEVVDIAKGKSVTQAIRDANKQKVNISSLNLDDAIKIGSGSRKLYVFSDPLCPYCKQVEREFDKLTDVTIYIFPMPLVGLHPEAQSLTESIWCSKDKATAWHNLVVGGIKPVSKSCPANPVERNLAFAKKYNIYGTPALIFADGEIVPGALPLASIEQKLTQAKK